MEELKLTINLLPKGAWGNDLSKTLQKKDWDKIRGYALKRAGGKCEICGYHTNELDVHEEWDFDIKKKTQTLKSVLAICTKCHGVKHFKNSVRLGFGEQAQEHFMKINNCTEMKFLSHLSKCLLEFNDQNTIFRWKIIADLEKFGGMGIEIKQNSIPIIKNPYENIDWNDYDYLKIEYNSLFTIYSNDLYYSEPIVSAITIDNFQGNIIVVCENVNRIEWFLDDVKIKTKYNTVDKFVTKFQLKDINGRVLKFKLFGIGGEIVSKNFEILPQEVL